MGVLSRGESTKRGTSQGVPVLDPFLAEFSKPYFDRSPHGSKIEVRIGAALETMKAYDAAKEDKSDTESFRSGDSGDQRWGGPGGGGGGRRDGRDGRDGRAPAPAPARRIDLRPELRNGMFFA